MKLAWTGKQTDANKALDNHAVITHRHALSALADNSKTEYIRHPHTHTLQYTLAQKSGGKRESESALHSEERRVMKRERQRKRSKERELNRYHLMLKILFIFLRCRCLELRCVEVDWDLNFVCIFMSLKKRWASDHANSHRPWTHTLH